MAEPLRRDPDVQPQPPAERRFNVHRYGDPNRGSRHWWFWILLVGVIVWFAVWGVGGSKKHQVATPVAVPQTPATPAGPAMDVASILSQPDTYIGKPVHMRDILVQSANDNASIFVGPSNDQQMLVILKKGSVPDTLKGKSSSIPQGGVVTIDGTAQKPPSASELEHSAKISRKQAEQVVKQGIVIEADSAVPQTI
jgi:hypothetical protein